MIDFDYIWELLIGTEVGSVTLYDPDTEEYGDPITGVQMLALQVGEKEQATGDDGQVARTDRRFHLRGAHLPGGDVTKRTIVTNAAGTKYIVQDAQKQTFGARWLVSCTLAKGS